MKSEKQLAIRPEAGTITVERLVARVINGQVRIPIFQRPLRWEAPQVIALFDSIYKGYPIGSLLLQKRAALKENFLLGPLRIEAPDVPVALWVVDGQQRLTSLAAGLARPMPVPVTPNDVYVVYFDALKQTFASPPHNGNISSTWVPVAQLFDSVILSEWVYEWQHGRNADLRASVFEAGKRLREYEVPLYTIETNDEDILRDIFNRTNTYGKKMNWQDVHKALFGNQGEYPSTLPELADMLEHEKGMGRPTEQSLLTYVMASKGLDPTRTLKEHSDREEEELNNKMKGAVHGGLPIISRALDFLHNEAEIPHVSLLPLALPMAIITRYFSLFPKPSSRSLQLLVRWTWRVLLGGAFFDERTILRRGVLTLEAGNDEKQVQALLQLVPKTLPEQLQYKLPARFDARAADSRLALLGMYSLQPLLYNKEPVDIVQLLASRKEVGLRTIVPPTVGKSELKTSPANRILLPGNRLSTAHLTFLNAERQNDFLEREDILLETEQKQSQLGISYQVLLKLNYDENEAFFKSHAIDALGFDALRRGDIETVLRRRYDLIQLTVRQLSSRLAAWDQSDRISIEQLVAHTIDEEF